MSGPPRRRSRFRSTTSPARATRTSSRSPPKLRRSPAMTSSRWRHGGRMRSAEQLEPVNDIVEPLIKQNGDVNGTVKYLGKARRQMARRSRLYRQPDQGALLAHRPDEEACRHRRAGNVSGRRAHRKPTTGRRTRSSRRPRPATRAAFPFGIGLGETSDSVDTVGAFFLAFGAEVVDAKGNVVVKNDNVRQALEYYKKLMAFLPPDAPAWDDGSNNKWLVSGKGALIMNPPSAWAVAKRDAPQIAEQCWTHGFPVGSERPLRAVPALLLEHLEFLQEQGGGQEPAGPSVATGCDREDWWRRAAAMTCRRTRSSPP